MQSSRSSFVGRSLAHGMAAPSPSLRATRGSYLIVASPDRGKDPSSDPGYRRGNGDAPRRRPDDRKSSKGDSVSSNNQKRCVLLLPPLPPPAAAWHRHCSLFSPPPLPVLCCDLSQHSLH